MTKSRLPRTVWTSSKSDWSSRIHELDVSESKLKELKREFKNYPGDKDRKRREAFSATVQDSSRAKCVK